jgi:hypothetical protein
MKRGRWLVIDGERPEDGAGPLHALFCDGVIIASYCQSLEYGHWQVAVYTSRVYSEGPSAVTLVTDEPTAVRMCLAIASLTEDDIETIEVPTIFKMAFDEE